MESKILEVLEKYDDIPVDYDFVKDTLSILRKEYKAEDYLKKVVSFNYINSEILDINWNGFYDRREKSIFINTASCDNFDISRLEKNIFILVLILHEFTHVRQRINKENNSLEKFLIKISHMLASDTKLEDIHDLIPSERFANIMSELSCIKILSIDFLKYQNEIHRRKKILYYHFLNGYEICEDGKIISPLERYLKEIKLFNRYKVLLNIDMKKYSLVERLLYGLNISEKEYNSIRDNYDYYSDMVDNKNKLKIKII